MLLMANCCHVTSTASSYTSSKEVFMYNQSVFKDCLAFFKKHSLDEGNKYNMWLASLQPLFYFFSSPTAHHGDLIMFIGEMSEGMGVTLFSVP